MYLPTLHVPTDKYMSNVTTDVILHNMSIFHTLSLDVVYDVSIIPMLVRVLSALLNHGVSVLYIASTVRNTDTRNAFIQALGE